MLEFWFCLLKVFRKMNHYIIYCIGKVISHFKIRRFKILETISRIRKYGLKYLL